jgi:hypothetical protein
MSFLISNFQPFSRCCTLHDCPYRRTTLWLQSTCVLGLQQTTKRRKGRTTRKGASIAEKTCQLDTLRTIVVWTERKANLGTVRRLDLDTDTLCGCNTSTLSRHNVRPETKDVHEAPHRQNNRNQIYQRELSFWPSKSLARDGLLPRGGLRE